jgi:hypothetical protein
MASFKLLHSSCFRPRDGRRLAYAIRRTIAALKPAIRECDLKGCIHHADHGLQWRAGDCNKDSRANQAETPPPVS